MEKHFKNVFINKNTNIQICQYTISRQDIVIFKNILSNAQVLKSCFINKIKDLYIENAYENVNLLYKLIITKIKILC